MSDFLETAYEVVEGAHGVHSGFEKAHDDEASVPDRAAGALKGTGSLLGTAGKLLGGTLPAGSTPALEALGGMGLGTGFATVGGILGAGALGLSIGQEIDHGIGRLTGKDAHEHLSDAMTGTMDERIEEQGLVPQRRRGTAGIAEANRLAMNRAVAHTRTLPQQQIERSDRIRADVRAIDDDVPFLANHARMDMAQLMGHWVD